MVRGDDSSTSSVDHNNPGFMSYSPAIESLNWGSTIVLRNTHKCIQRSILYSDPDLNNIEGRT